MVPKLALLGRTIAFVSHTQWTSEGSLQTNQVGLGPPKLLGKPHSNCELWVESTLSQGFALPKILAGKEENQSLQLSLSPKKYLQEGPAQLERTCVTGLTPRDKVPGAGNCQCSTQAHCKRRACEKTQPTHKFCSPFIRSHRQVHCEDDWPP